MFTLEQIALAVKGEVVGDPSIQIISVDDINEAAKGSITFSFLPKYKTKISSSNASAFVTDAKDDLKGMDYIEKFMINIPVGWWLNKNDIKNIVKIINSY